MPEVFRHHPPPPPPNLMQNVSLCSKLVQMIPGNPSAPSTYKPVLVTARLPFCQDKKKKKQQVSSGHRVLTLLQAACTPSSP